MKLKLIFNCIAFIALLLPINVLAGNIGADTDGLSRKIEKEFAIVGNPYIEIENRYGKVEIKEWNEAKVKFEINIEVISADTLSQRQVFNSIQIDLSANPSQILGRTSFTNTNSSLSNDLKRLLSGIILPNMKFNIDYVVHMPATANLIIRNKYGDVTLGNHSGSLDIQLSNGNLNATDINGEFRLSMSMGRGFVNEIENGHLDLSYVEDFMLHIANKLIIDSKLSKITVNNSQNLRLNSRRDNLMLKRTNRIMGTSYFSNVWVMGLAQDLNLDAKYGQINLDEVSKSFTSVNITSEFTDISIVFQSGAAYQFDLAGNRTRFNYPQQNSKLTNSANPKDPKMNYFVGTIGTGDASGASVRITSNNASLNIIHQ